MTLAQGNVGVAFAVTVAAGAATMAGSSVVFFPKLVKLASRRMLAGSLGFSAGVMIYISFVDIFQKSVDAFVSNGMDDNSAYGFATLYFFIGIAVLKVSSIVKVTSNTSSKLLLVHSYVLRYTLPSLWKYWSIDFQVITRRDVAVMTSKLGGTRMLVNAK